MKTGHVLYYGKVRHRRNKPKHTFTYRLYMFYLNLDEIEREFSDKLLWGYERPGLISFKRKDYHGTPDLPIKQAIYNTVEEKLGFRPEGPVYMLTQLRLFGYVFNPVTFYYCYDPSGKILNVIMAEIQNTPWMEKHTYLMDMRSNTLENKKNTRSFDFKKAFHISPFMDMDMTYRWYFNCPGKRLSIHMENYKNELKTFDATLLLKRKPLSKRSVTWGLWFYPFLTFKITAGIYWQALLLWVKRAEFYTHPKKITNHHL